MAEYSIGEVEKLTGIKSHVLRYWEEVIPFIRPRKDDQGRRYYSPRDIQLFARIQYLVEEKKYTLAGAGERLITELTDARFARTREDVESVRSELMNLYAIVHKWKENEL